MAVFLAGGPDQGGLGLFLIASAGVLVFVRPPSWPDWKLFLLLGLVGIGGLLAFLPQEWFGIPDWRKALADNGAIPLAASIAVMPSYAAYWWTILAATCAVFLYLQSSPLPGNQLAWLVLAACVVIACYSALAVMAKETSWVFPYSGGATFGFLPNRNHTGTFLMVGAVTSIGLASHDLIGRRYVRGSLACLCCAPPVAALLFYSESRAGVLIFACGVVLLLAGVGGKRLGKRTLVVLATLGITALLSFFLYDNPARDRLAQMADVSLKRSFDEPAGHASTTQDPTLDFRLLIFRDALRLSSEFPLTGVGLGNFQYVFPFYRKISLSESQCVHPESDWLLILTEMGWIPVLALLATIVLLGRQVWKGREREDWPLRWAVASAMIAALLHGTIDVPLHRVALGWFFLVLGLAAIPISDPKRERSRSLWAWIVFATAGLAIGAQGLKMVRAEWFGAKAMPPFQWAGYSRELQKLGRERRFEEADQTASTAIRELPMLPDAYYWKAGYLLTFADTDAEAAQYLGAARLLDPTWPAISQEQARLWMPIDSKRAAEAWFDSIERGRRIDRVSGEKAIPVTRRTLTDALQETRKHPAIQLALLERIRKVPSLLADWILNADDDLARGEIARVATPADFFASLPPDERTRMLSRWIHLGNIRAAVDFMEKAQAESPSPGPYWKILAQSYAGSNQVEKAVRLAAKSEGISLAVHWQDAEADTSAMSPLEIELHELWQNRNIIAVQRTVADAVRSDPPDKNSLRIAVAFYASNGRWPEAWQALAKLSP